MGDMSINSNPKIVTVAQDQAEKSKKVIEPAWKKWREEGSDPMGTPNINFGVEGDIDPGCGWALTDAEYLQAQSLVERGLGWEEAVKHVTGKSQKQIAAERHAAQSPYMAAAREKMEAGDLKGGLDIITNMWKNKIGNRQS